MYCIRLQLTPSAYGRLKKLNIGMLRYRIKNANPSLRSSVGQTSLSCKREREFAILLDLKAKWSLAATKRIWLSLCLPPCWEFTPLINSLSFVSNLAPFVDPLEGHSMRNGDDFCSVFRSCITCKLFYIS